MPTLTTRTGQAAARPADALLYFACEGRTAELPGLAAWLAAHAPDLPPAGLTDFRAEAGQTVVLYPAAGGPRLLLAGLGKAAAAGPAQLRLAAAAAAQKARELRLAVVGLDVSAPCSALDGLPLAPAQALEEILLSAAMGLYDFKARTAPKADTPPLPELAVLAEAQLAPELALAVELARAQATGLELTRDLVNTPANQATPCLLARKAQELAQRHGFRAEVFDPEQIAALGMGAYVSVCQGGGEPARFVVLDTGPEGEKPLVFVGKGITFDTGGISLKPPAKMDQMKGDMAGAATVLGLFAALGELGAGRRVVGLLPCTENMPGPAAIKPGDVVVALSGKTVEIVNTDAEGRLLLCDALAYAARFEPALIVDIATLTGACVVALGTALAAVFSDSPGLAEGLRDVSAALGEPCWPMPLWGPYAEVLTSEVADLKNVGPREGGAIHAAMFLKQFVPEGVPWAHLDIAGPAWSEKKSGPVGVGGTGFGLRTLLALVRRPELTNALTPAANGGAQ